MFCLHETTRIRICRWAFFTLCVLPTCAVMTWCVMVRLPSYLAAHESLIARQLGLKVRLARASSPQPSMMLYEGLELADPQTGQPLARLPFVEVRTSGSTLLVKLPYPAMVNGDRLTALWNLAYELVGDQPDFRPVRFEARNLTLHLTGGDQTLTDLQAELHQEKSEGRLNLFFRPAVAGNKTAAPAQLRLTRNRDPRTPRTVCQFSSGGPLPCNLAAGVWPATRNLGAASTFHGRIRISHRGDDWETELTGNLTGIGLDSLLSEFRHKLTGQADVQLEHALIKNGRIEAAVGTLEAGPGIVSGSLIYAGQTHLGFKAAPEVLASRDPYFQYQQLGLAFEINVRGLALKGIWPKQPDAILLGKHGVLVREPRVDSQSVVNLARTLVPNTDLQGPVVKETGGLMNVLPVPSIQVQESTRLWLPKRR